MTPDLEEYFTLCRHFEVTLLERRLTLSRPRKTRRLVSFRSKGSLHIVMYHETTVGCSERQERAYPSHQDGPSQPVHAWP
jgi:hypothetical protein